MFVRKTCCVLFHLYALWKIYSVNIVFYSPLMKAAGRYIYGKHAVFLFIYLLIYILK